MGLNITRLEDPNILLEINNSAIPDISMLDLSKAQWLVSHLVAPGLALLDEKPAGIVAVLSDHCGYQSDYYRWFTEQYENFLYIDRVVVAEWARGRGVAKQIYEAIDAIARDKQLAIVADVYSEPPNLPSLNLHYAMGFEEIGAQHFPAIQKTAAKLMRYKEYVRRKS